MSLRKPHPKKTIPCRNNNPKQQHTQVRWWSPCQSWRVPCMVAEGKRKSFRCEEGETQRGRFSRQQKAMGVFSTWKKNESKIPGRNQMLFKEARMSYQLPSILFSVLMAFGTRSDFLILDAFWMRAGDSWNLKKQPFFLPSFKPSCNNNEKKLPNPQSCVAIHKQQVNFQACSFGGSKMPMIDTASSHFSLSMSYHATKMEIFSKGIESLQWGVHA